MSYEVGAFKIVRVLIWLGRFRAHGKRVGLVPKLVWRVELEAELRLVWWPASTAMSKLAWRTLGSSACRDEADCGGASSSDRAGVGGHSRLNQSKNDLGNFHALKRPRFS
jgi:hypothetical protein